MQKIIEQIEGLRDSLRNETNQTPYFGNAISALSAAADNLRWHEQARGAAKAEQPATETKKPVKN